MPPNTHENADERGESRGVMALIDLHSWFGRRDWSSTNRVGDPDAPADVREAVICSRDRKLEKELIAILGEQGFVCSTVRNTWAARYSVRRASPALIIIDWRLGQNQAAKLSEALSKTEHGRVSSTLALLPADQTEELSKILDFGVNDFVMLPLVAEQLIARLSLIETRHRELAQMRALQRTLEVDYDRFLLATGGRDDGVWDLDLKTETIQFSKR